MSADARSRGQWFGALGLAAALVAAGGCSTLRDATAAPPASTSSATAGAISDALAAVKVVPRRTAVPGYERSCGRGKACSFGPAWTDNNDSQDGHDGCDTRNNVLRRQLTDVVTKAGTRGCVVMSGQLSDPYTGHLIDFRKTAARKVQIDHIYPLARAWDLGAARWPASRRVDFANDVSTNLLAVDGSANASKGDQGPAEWLPINRAYRCTYVLRYLQVAAKYKLPVTADDQYTARTIAKTCP